MLCIAGLQGHPHAAWRCAQLFQGDPRGDELVTVGGVDVAVPELRSEAEARGKLEDYVGIWARFARRRNDGLTELNVRLRLWTNIEADLERFALEAGCNRQHHVGKFGCGRHEQVCV